MKYQIVAARYEGIRVLRLSVWATAESEAKAQCIVDALNESDEATLFHFSIKPVVDDYARKADAYALSVARANDISEETMHLIETAYIAGHEHL